MLALALVAAAVAAPEDVAEEVIVYGDDFARWNDTRWHVQTEILLPLGLSFAADRNRSFTSYAFQVRAVIACDKDAKLSRKKWEVSCEFEDIGFLVTTLRHWRRAKDHEVVQAVLDEIDAKLTGAKVQMQVDSSGGVTNFDIEGITASNERERQIQETLRQLVSRVMAGFHLRIPDHAQRGGQFVEYRSELMDLPSLTSSRGSTTLVHLVSPDKPKPGLQLVQTVGEGMTAVYLPAPEASDPFHAGVIVDDGGVGAAEGGGLGSGPASVDVEAPEDDAAVIGSADAKESNVEATYEMKATGVALFEKDTGIMTERVWVCHGFGTASSAGGVSMLPYRNVGRIQLLGEADHPDVGPTRQVAWPGQEKRMEDLPAWVDIESLPTE